MQKERSVLDVHSSHLVLEKIIIILLSFTFRRVLCWTGQADNHSLLQLSAELDKLRRGMTEDWLLLWLEFVS